MLALPPRQVPVFPPSNAPDPDRTATVRPRPWKALGAVCALVVALAGCRAVASTAPATKAAPAAAVTGRPVRAPLAGWRLNGSARLSAGGLVLTTAGRRMTAGSAIWPHTLRAITSLHVSFDVLVAGGSGADGTTFAMINARTGRPTSLGAVGGGLGWAGIPGRAVALDTFQNPGDPSYNDIGLVSGSTAARPDRLTWGKWNADVPPLRNHTRHVTVAVASGVLTVTIDGATALTASLALPNKLLVGFTAANGARSDRHVVSNVTITVN